MYSCYVTTATSKMNQSNTITWPLLTYKILPEPSKVRMGAVGGARQRGLAPADRARHDLERTCRRHAVCTNDQESHRPSAER